MADAVLAVHGVSMSARVCMLADTSDATLDLGSSKAYIVMAYEVTTYIVIAYMVIAYICMAHRRPI